MNKITCLNSLPNTVKVSALKAGTLVSWKGKTTPESVYIVGNGGEEAINLTGDGYISSTAEVTVLPKGTVLTITVGKES